MTLLTLTKIFYFFIRIMSLIIFLFHQSPHLPKSVLSMIFHIFLPHFHLSRLSHRLLFFHTSFNPRICWNLIDSHIIHYLPESNFQFILSTHQPNIPIPTTRKQIYLNKLYESYIRSIVDCLSCFVRTDSYDLKFG